MLVIKGVTRKKKEGTVQRAASNKSVNERRGANSKKKVKEKEEKGCEKGVLIDWSRGGRERGENNGQVVFTRHHRWYVSVCVHVRIYTHLKTVA